jgi:hypothetical protein
LVRAADKVCISREVGNPVRGNFEGRRYLEMRREQIDIFTEDIDCPPRPEESREEYVKRFQDFLRTGGDVLSIPPEREGFKSRHGLD